VDAMLGILGTTALLLDSGPDATWGGQRERAVLATLAVHAGDVVPVEVMLRWVWPRDKPAPVNPEPMLDTCASRIRRVLERLPSPPRLRFGLGGYRLEIERARIDLNRFRDLAAEARAFAGRDPARAVDLVDDALWLWRGLPLADLHGLPRTRSGCGPCSSSAGTRRPSPP
jgi:DNA-binding SARP family transcriptional activator